MVKLCGVKKIEKFLLVSHDKILRHREAQNCTKHMSVASLSTKKDKRVSLSHLSAVVNSAAQTGSLTDVKHCAAKVLHMVLKNWIVSIVADPTYEKKT